jgi:acyl carrier protein
MQRATVIEKLTNYIGQNILEGKDIGLDETTPLLEWGIINSLEMTTLLSFIRQAFDVEIPMEQLIPEHFASLSSIADLVLEQKPA